MSDTSQGEGWWRASDGKWYPPESHPDYVPPAAPTPPPAPPAPEPVVAAPPPVPPAPEPVVATPVAPPPIDDPAATVTVPVTPSVPPAGAAPIPPVPGSAQPSAGFNPAESIPWFVIIGGGILVALGAVLPWASVGDLSVNGLDFDDGPIVLVLGIAIIGLAVAHMLTRQMWAFVLVILASLGALVTSIIDITDIDGSVPGVSVGIGLWLALAGSLVAGGGIVWSRLSE